MLARKIRIDNYLSIEDKEKIKNYSSLLSEAYNLCLDSLKENCDFKKIHIIAKDFAKKHNLNSKHVQNTGIECINCVKSYFKLKKKDNKARFPKNYRIGYSSIIMDINLQKRKTKNNEIIYYICGGFSLVNKTIIINSINTVINLINCDWYDTDLININTLKQIVIKITEKENIDLCFIYQEKKQPKIQYNKNFISIDLGISSIASFYSSNGDCNKIQTKRFKGLEKSINHMKAIISNKVKKSNHYNKMMSSIKRKITKLTNKRKDYLHKASKHIINYCLTNNIDNIICGDIQTKKLVKQYKHGINKSTQNEGLLSRFKGFLQYKANKNNINFILVNESYTSQTNCITDIRNLSSDLSIRKIEVLPNVIIDRDINSAVNIAKKYGDLWLSHTFNYINLLNVNKIDIIL